MKRVVCVTVFGLIACASCGPDSKPAEKAGPSGSHTRKWSCSSQASTCRCNGSADTGSLTIGDLVGNVVCGSLNCCLLTEGPKPPSGGVADASCECFDAVSSCDAEQAARPGTKIVSQCPPPEESAPMACATEGISCNPDYLASQNLHDCCPGLTCAANAQSVQVCRALPEAEASLVNDCNRAVAGNEESHLVEPVATSTGNLPINAVRSIHVDHGPGGCITQVDAFLTGPPGGLARCFLEVKAGPATDASGNFVITETMFAVDDCPTLPPGVRTDSRLTGAAGTISFDGLSCQSRYTSADADPCYAGTLEIRLTGQIPALVGDSVALTGAPFHTTGRFCSLPNPFSNTTTCPMRP